MKKFAKAQKGFTLIELLIVIVILGILAAVAIPQVTKFIQNGKAAAANSELALVNTAMSTLMADAQITNLTAAAAGGPTTISGLTAASGTDITVTAGTPVTTYKLSDYITGGVTALKGSYTISNTAPSIGSVTGTPTYPGVTFVSGKFQ